MAKVAKLASRLNWRHGLDPMRPRLFLFTDQDRLPDPSRILPRLGRGTCVVLRHTDTRQLEVLARAVVPAAHRLGLRVLIANDLRLAIKLKADGIHLSQKSARRGALRIHALPKGFIVTAAAHDARGLWRGAIAGAHLAIVSPVFSTASHPHAQNLGIWRFYALAHLSRLPVIALGGIDHARAKRLKIAGIWGIAAIDGWQD